MTPNSDDMKRAEEIMCLMCGVKKDAALYADCLPESEKWGIELAGQAKPYLGKHVWTLGRIMPWKKRVGLSL